MRGQAGARSAPPADATPGGARPTTSGAPNPAGRFWGRSQNGHARAVRPARLCRRRRLARPASRPDIVAGHRALTSNVVLAPGAPAPSCQHTGIVGNRSAARLARRRGHREHAPWGFFGGSVETDVRVRSFPLRALGAARGAGGRHAEAGRLLVTRADRPGIAAAVSSFPFSGGANFTGRRRYSTDPLIGAFFLWNEFQLAREAECFRNPVVSFGEIAGSFSARRQITMAGAGRAGRGPR